MDRVLDAVRAPTSKSQVLKVIGGPGTGKTLTMGLAAGELQSSFHVTEMHGWSAVNAANVDLALRVATDSAASKPSVLFVDRAERHNEFAAKFLAWVVADKSRRLVLFSHTPEVFCTDAPTITLAPFSESELVAIALATRGAGHNVRNLDALRLLTTAADGNATTMQFGCYWCTYHARAAHQEPGLAHAQRVVASYTQSKLKAEAKAKQQQHEHDTRQRKREV